jgi:hypothetical protein
MSAKCQKRTWASFSPEWKTCSGGRMRTLLTSIEAHQPDLLGKLGAVSGEQAKAIRRLTTELQRAFAAVAAQVPGFRCSRKHRRGHQHDYIPDGDCVAWEKWSWSWLRAVFTSSRLPTIE